MLPRARAWPDLMFEKRGAHGRIAPMAGGDGTTFSADFTGGVPPGWTWARGSADPATYVDVAGLVRTTTGMRFANCNPTTLAPIQGALLEPQATNLIAYSATFNSGTWGYSNASVADSSGPVVLAPDGVSTAKVFTSTGAAPLISYAFSTTAGCTVATFSFWWKNGNCSDAVGGMKDFCVRNNTSSTIICRISLNPDSGTFTYDAGTRSAFPNNDVVMTAYPNGWYRVEMRCRTGLAASVVGCYVCGLGAGGMPSGQYCYLWGAQYEEQHWNATSYVATAGGAVTRSKDTLTRAVAAAEFNQLEGTIFAELAVAAEIDAVSGFPPFLSFQTAGLVRAWRLLCNNSALANPRITTDLWDSAPSTIPCGAVVKYRPVAQGSFKTAWAFKTDGDTAFMSSALTGQSTSVGSAASTQFLPTVTSLRLNQDNASAANYEYFPVFLRSIRYWNRQMTGPEITALVA